MAFVRVLKRIIAENIPIKIAALLIALLVYFNVYTEAEQEKEFSVPMRVESIPQGLCYSGEIPPEARVLIRGNGKQLLKLKLRKAVLAVDVSHAGRGIFERKLAPEDVLLPSVGKVTVAEIVSPKSITLNFDFRMEKNAGVDAVISGNPREGYEVSGNPSLHPDTVLVSGPAEVLKKVTSVKTEPVDLSGKTESFSKEVPVDLQGNRFSCIPAKVSVSLTIRRK